MRLTHNWYLMKATWTRLLTIIYDILLKDCIRETAVRLNVAGTFQPHTNVYFIFMALSLFLVTQKKVRNVSFGLFVKMGRYVCLFTFQYQQL